MQQGYATDITGRVFLCERFVQVLRQIKGLACKKTALSLFGAAKVFTIRAPGFQLSLTLLFSMILARG